MVVSSTFFQFSNITSSNGQQTVLDDKIPVVSSIGKSGATPPTTTLVNGATSNANNIMDKKSSKSSTEKSNVEVKSYGKPKWSGMPLYVDPYNSASLYLANSPDAKSDKNINRMANTPVAQWFGDWNINVTSDVNNYVTSATADQSLPVVVLYNIPNRDCGGYSTGGAEGISGYEQWIQRVASGVGENRAVIILEPDALGALDCLPASIQNGRIQALSRAVTILKSLPNASVYIDAGTPVWQPVDVMASRLISANVEVSDGFSLNVSYFASTSSNLVYGDSLSSKTGGKHYVVDTSRNGGDNHVTGMHCNPMFASFGQFPTSSTSSPLNDALLWIKIPWESDGQCNGSPGPGQPYWSYAQQLAVNAGW